MPRFSQASKDALATCHVDLQRVMREVIKEMDVKVLEGHRPQARQEKLFREGNSQVRWPNSNHNCVPSLAVDVAPYPIDWEDRARFHAMGFYVLGVAHALYHKGEIGNLIRWGGDWDRDWSYEDEGFYDGPHFEIIT